MKKYWIKTHNKHQCPICDFTYWDNKTWNYCPKCGECLGKKYNHKSKIFHADEKNYQLTIDF